MAKVSEKPLDNPFTILIDQREKAPYFFHGLRANSARSYRPLVINCEFAHLPTGDYTIAGMQDRVCVERKSLADLYSTLGSNRDRFEREHERMAQFEFAAVVVEANMETILRHPPKESRLEPKSVYGTYLAWTIRYGVNWYLMEDRRLAEITTFRLLEKFYFETQKKELANGNLGCNTGTEILSQPAAIAGH